MDYIRKYFDPGQHRGEGERRRLDDNDTFEWKEGKDETQVHVFAPKVTLAVNIAMAARRPLLISGEPGSGKSTLARAVAKVLGAEYFAHVVTSRTQASDLLWTHDALQRLNDATSRDENVRPARYYVEPGALWWAFDPATATNRGVEALPPENQASRRMPLDGKTSDRAVVLVDEIDKADPDVPNDLLEPFDLKRFTVRETGDTIVSTRNVNLIVTTNGERELSPAFLRRCVVLTLEEPQAPWLCEVAARWFPDGDRDLQVRIADEVMRLRETAGKNELRKPSTAEYLDALRVCAELRVDEKWSDWKKIVAAVLVKRDGPGATVETLMGD